MLQEFRTVISRLRFLHVSKPKTPPRQEALPEEIRDALRARQVPPPADPVRPAE